MTRNKLLTLGLSFFLIFVGFGCKKAVDNAQENALFDIITSNTWVVTKMEIGTTNYKTEFDPYQFQFSRNGVVAAKRTGINDVNGQWNLTLSNLSILINYSSAGLPLSRTDGLWFISGTTFTTVDATREEGGVTYKLSIKAL
jgi:hypothetical protein